MKIDEKRDPHRFLCAATAVVSAATPGGKAEFVHHPVGLRALPGAAPVVDQGLLQADAVTAAAASRIYGSVDAGCLPEAGPSDPVGSYAVPVLPPPHAEEVPLLVPMVVDPFKIFK